MALQAEKFKKHGASICRASGDDLMLLPLMAESRRAMGMGMCKELT